MHRSYIYNNICFRWWTQCCAHQTISVWWLGKCVVHTRTHQQIITTHTRTHSKLFHTNQSIVELQNVIRFYTNPNQRNILTYFFWLFGVQCSRLGNFANNKLHETWKCVSQNRTHKKYILICRDQFSLIFQMSKHNFSFGLISNKITTP